MKIAFLFKRDSHFKAVKSTALRVCAQYNCEPIFIGVNSEYSPINETRSVVHIDTQDLTSLLEYDYIIACLGGYLLNHVVSALRHTNTKVISIFPGIVSHYQLDAFVSRLNADQVWLNSKADFDLYSNICSMFKYPNNGILYGMSWLDSENCIKNSSTTIQSKKAIFFEQTEILYDYICKKYFSKKIVEIITSNPGVTFKYKVRDNTTDKYFTSLRQLLSTFNNVEVVYDLEVDDTASSSYYLSISSSAIIEGIVSDKNTYLIDKGLLDIDSLEFFKGSNLFMKDVVLNKESSLNIAWSRRRISLPRKKVSLTYISKRKTTLKLLGRSYIDIRVYIASLSIKNLKYLKLVFEKNRIKSIQRSLEYLDS